MSVRSPASSSSSSSTSARGAGLQLRNFFSQVPHDGFSWKVKWCDQNDEDLTGIRVSIRGAKKVLNTAVFQSRTPALGTHWV